MSDTAMSFGPEQGLTAGNGLQAFSRLPDWLVAARDPDLVCSKLAAVVPEFARGEMRLEKCDVGHIRYKNDHWTGLYHLTMRVPGEESPQTVTLEGAIHAPGVLPAEAPHSEGRFGTPGWHLAIPELNLELKTQEAEKVLASLSFLTDPEESRIFLMRNIQAGSPKYQDIEIQASNPQIVRYKPGSRCTVLYRLEYPQSAAQPHQRRWPELVIAKTYRNEKGKNAFDGMVALWNSPLSASSSVQIAEPIAYNEQQRVMIQGPIREDITLKKYMTNRFRAGTAEAMEEVNRMIRKTAAGLAELHQTNVPLDKVWQWEDELAEVQERIEHLSVSHPGLADAAQPLLDRIRQLADATPPDLLVSSHGSFRPAQVLLYRDEIGFIDFDSVCQSEPGNDLALFLSSVMSLAMTNTDFDESRDSGATMDEATRKSRFETAMSLHEQFLDEYEQHRPVSRQRVALWEVLDIFMLVLHGWIKVKVGELGDTIYLMEQFLRAQRFIS